MSAASIIPVIPVIPVIPAIAANQCSSMKTLKSELEHAYFEVTSKKQGDVKYKVFVAKKCEHCQSFFQEVATHVCTVTKSTDAKTSTTKTPANLKTDRRDKSKPEQTRLKTSVRVKASSTPSTSTTPSHTAKSKSTPPAKNHVPSAQTIIQNKIYGEQAKNLAVHFIQFPPVDIQQSTEVSTQDSSSTNNHQWTTANIKTIKNQLLSTEQRAAVIFSEYHTDSKNLATLFTHTLKLYDNEQRYNDVQKRVTFINTLRHPDIGAHQAANKLSKAYPTWQSLISE